MSWTRPHWRNRNEAIKRRDGENNNINPWYILIRHENTETGDSVSVGYSDEELSAYVVALNGNPLDAFTTREEARKASTKIRRKVPQVSHDQEELDYNEARRYVKMNGVTMENPSKSDLREAIEEIQRDIQSVYDIDSVEVTQEE